MLIQPLGLFSLNVQEPCNGARGTHLNPDGTLSGFSGFYGILGGSIVLAISVWVWVWWVFRVSQKAIVKRGGKVETFG